MARPKSTDKETASLHYSVNVTPADKELIDRAAESEDERMPSRWLRKVGLREARRLLGIPAPGAEPPGKVLDGRKIARGR